MRKISAILLFLAAFFGMQEAWAAGQYTGDRRALCIYMSFADAQVATADEWTRQLNGVDYQPNGGVGSVRDYFYDMSYGQFNLQFDCLPYTVSGNRSTYAASNAAGNTGKFAPALTAALNDLYTGGQLTDEMIARYDWDNDGNVDQVIVIFAGPAGQNMSGSGFIRSHESEMTAITLGGKRFSTYAACAETRDDNKTIDGIGGVAHEIVHCFGLPDFYTSSAYVMQYWDLMDAGTYNGDNWNGTIPPQMTSFERWVAGWITPTVLSSTQDVNGMRPMMEAAEAYVIYNTESPAVSGSIAKFPEGGQYKEFFLIENRKSDAAFGTTGRKWDAPIGSFNGLLAIHVDFDETQWHATAPNGTATHQRMTIVPAGSKTNGNGSDLWTSGTIQPMNVFNGTSPLNCSVGNIAVQADGTVNFSFSAEGVIPGGSEKEAGYYRGTSIDEVKDGAEFIVTNPWGWAICEPYYYDDVNPETSWGHYPANKANAVVGAPIDGNESYTGDVNVAGKPYVFVFESAADGKYYIKDKTTGKYLHGYYADFLGTGRYAMDETAEPESVWTVEYNEDYNGGEFYLTTTANGNTVYLTEVSSASAFSNGTFDENQKENWSVRTSTTYTLALFFWKDAENAPEPEPEPVAAVYTKAQASTDVKDGDTILLINDNGYAYGLYDSYYGSTPTVGVTLADGGNTYNGKVNGSGLPYELTLEATEGGYYIKDGGKYMFATYYSDDFYYVDLFADVTGAPVWQFDIVDGVADITTTVDGAKLWLTIQSFTDGAVDYTIRPYNNYTIGVFVKGEGGDVTPEPEPEPEPEVLNTEGTYVRIASADELQAGDKVLFVYEQGNLAMTDMFADYGYNFDATSVSVAGGVYTGAVNAEGAPYEYVIDRDAADIYFQQAISKQWISESNDGTYSYMTLDDASALPFNVSVDANGIAALNFTSFKGNAMFITYYAGYADFEFSMSSWGDKPNFAIYKRLDLGENDAIAFAAPSQYSKEEETIIEAWRNNTAAPEVGEKFLLLSENGWWAMTADAANISVGGPGHDNDLKGEVDGEGLLGTFTRTAEGYIQSSNGKYLTMNAVTSGRSTTYSLSYDETPSTVWTFQTQGQYQRISARINNRNVYIYSPTREAGAFTGSTSGRNVSVFRYIDKIVETKWYDVDPVVFTVEHGATAICAADAYQLPAGLTASYVASGAEADAVVKVNHYKGGDIVPPATPVLIEGADGEYNARIFTMGETGTMTIVYGDENLLEASRNAEGYTASTREGVSYYGLADGESGYGFYRVDNQGSAFPIEEGLAYLAVVVDDVRGYLLPDLEVAPTVWIGDVITPEEVETIDELLDYTIDFQYAEEVESAPLGAIAALFDENGQPYAIFVEDLFGSVEYEGSKAIISFKTLAELEEELAPAVDNTGAGDDSDDDEGTVTGSIRRLLGARIAGFTPVAGQASVYVCSSSFSVDGAVYKPSIARSYDVVGEGGITTGVNTVLAPAPARTYDLNGRLVRQNARGIVIDSGVKVMR